MGILYSITGASYYSLSEITCSYDAGKQKIHELAVSLGIEDVGATNLADAFYKVCFYKLITSSVNFLGQRSFIV